MKSLDLSIEQDTSSYLYVERFDFSRVKDCLIGGTNSLKESLGNFFGIVNSMKSVLNDIKNYPEEQKLRFINFINDSGKELMIDDDLLIRIEREVDRLFSNYSLSAITCELLKEIDRKSKLDGQSSNDTKLIIDLKKKIKKIATISKENDLGNVFEEMFRMIDNIKSLVSHRNRIVELLMHVKFHISVITMKKFLMNLYGEQYLNKKGIGKVPKTTTYIFSNVNSTEEFLNSASSGSLKYYGISHVFSQLFMDLRSIQVLQMRVEYVLSNDSYEYGLKEFNNKICILVSKFIEFKGHNLCVNHMKSLQTIAKDSLIIIQTYDFASPHTQNFIQSSCLIKCLESIINSISQIVIVFNYIISLSKNFVDGYNPSIIPDVFRIPDDSSFSPKEISYCFEPNSYQLVFLINISQSLLDQSVLQYNDEQLHFSSCIPDLSKQFFELNRILKGLPENATTKWLNENLMGLITKPASEQSSFLILQESIRNVLKTSFYALSKEIYLRVKIIYDTVFYLNVLHMFNIIPFNQSIHLTYIHSIGKITFSSLKYSNDFMNSQSLINAVLSNIIDSKQVSYNSQISVETKLMHGFLDYIQDVISSKNIDDIKDISKLVYFVALIESKDIFNSISKAIISIPNSICERYPHLQGLLSYYLNQLNNDAFGYNSMNFLVNVFSNEASISETVTMGDIQNMSPILPSVEHLKINGIIKSSLTIYTLNEGICWPQIITSRFISIHEHLARFGKNKVPVVHHLLVLMNQISSGSYSLSYIVDMITMAKLLSFELNDDEITNIINELYISCNIWRVVKHLSSDFKLRSFNCIHFLESFINKILYLNIAIPSENSSASCLNSIEKLKSILGKISYGKELPFYIIESIQNCLLSIVNTFEERDIEVHISVIKRVLEFSRSYTKSTHIDRFLENLKEIDIFHGRFEKLEQFLHEIYNELYSDIQCSEGSYLLVYLSNVINTLLMLLYIKQEVHSFLSFLCTESDYVPAYSPNFIFLHVNSIKISGMNPLFSFQKNIEFGNNDFWKFYSDIQSQEKPNNGVFQINHIMDLSLTKQNELGSLIFSEKNLSKAMLKTLEGSKESYYKHLDQIMKQKQEFEDLNARLTISFHSLVANQKEQLDSMQRKVDDETKELTLLRNDIEMNEKILSGKLEQIYSRIEEKQNYLKEQQKNYEKSKQAYSTIDQIHSQTTGFGHIQNHNAKMLSKDSDYAYTESAQSISSSESLMQLAPNKSLPLPQSVKSLCKVPMELPIAYSYKTIGNTLDLAKRVKGNIPKICTAIKNLDSRESSNQEELMCTDIHRRYNILLDLLN